MNHPGSDGSHPVPAEEPHTAAPQFAPVPPAPTPPAPPLPPSVQPTFTPVAFTPVATATSDFPPIPAPVPLPPTYDPAAVAAVGQPFSAPPTSGPYGYGIPMSVIPAVPEKPRSRVGTVILSALTALFLVAAGILGTLFVLKNQEASKLDSQVAQLNTDLAAANNKASTLQKDLDSTKRDLTDAKAQTEEMSKQKKVVADCINALFDYFEAAARANSATAAPVRAKEADADAKCDAAQKYL